MAAKRVGTRKSERPWAIPLAIVAGACALSWPAVYNGFPLLFPDSVNYLNDGRHIVDGLMGTNPMPLGWTRGPLYSLVIYLLHGGQTPWPIVGLQALITAAMLWLVVRSLLTRHRVPIYLGLVGGLSVLTGLGWVVSWLLPDILGPLFFLGCYLLVFARETLSRLEAGLVACVVVWAVASHPTHMMLAAALWALLGLLLVVGGEVTRPRAQSVRTVAILIAIALTAQVAVTSILTGRLSLFGPRPPFLMARLVADGPARQVLHNRCRELPWVICNFADRLPSDPNEFLWGAGNVMASVTPEQAEQLRHEELPLLWATLRGYPAQQMRASLANFGRQLITFGLDDFRNNPWAAQALPVVMPSAGAPYQRSRQARDAMPSKIFSSLQTWTITAAVLLLAVLVPVCWRGRQRRLLGLSVVLLPMIVGNAMVTGVLSIVDSRYQLRVVWLLPLLASLITLRLLEEREGARPAETARGPGAPPRRPARQQKIGLLTSCVDGVAFELVRASAAGVPVGYECARRPICLRCPPARSRGMSSSCRRLGITIVLLSLASILPATVGAQPPVYLTQWGTHGSGPGEFNKPLQVAVDAAGDVYVADWERESLGGNSRIQKFTGAGSYITQWGSAGIGNGQFLPAGVAADPFGNVYVADDANFRIEKFNNTGTYLTQWGSYGSGPGQFDNPIFVATDGAGNVYVSELANQRIQKFAGDGTYLTQWGSLGSGPGQFFSPDGVAADAFGNVFVVDRGNDRVQKFTDTGIYLTQWGSNGSGDGQFFNPGGVATDAAGNVYVADSNNHRIQKFTGAGAYLTQWGSFGGGNGQFQYPYGVAVNAAGDIYVADFDNFRIQKFGQAQTPTKSSSWGRIKSLYR